MYILTTFAGKKLCAGSFDKCQLYAVCRSVPKYCKLWCIDSNGIYLMAQYQF